MHIIFFPFIIAFRLIQLILKIIFNLIRSALEIFIKILTLLLRLILSAIHLVIYSLLKILVKVLMGARFIFQITKLAFVASLRHTSDMLKTLGRILHPIIHPISYFFKDVAAFLGLGDDFVILIMKPFSPIFGKFFNKPKRVPGWKVVSSKRKHHA